MQSNGYSIQGPSLVANDSKEQRLNISANISGLSPLTVEEALPYTPFSSVVPFNPGT
jgi:hypothetical protein